MPTDDLIAARASLPFGVAITDALGVVTRVNAAFAESLGRTAEELPGQSAGEFPFAELVQAPPSLQPWRREAVWRRASGDEILPARLA